MSKREHSGQVPQPYKDGSRQSVDGAYPFSDDDESEEYESEEDEIFQQSEDSDMDDAHTDIPGTKKVWLPGTQLAKDEVLEADQSAYEILHSIDVKWPCLTFDSVWDSLGEERRSYPATCYIVTGTQADQANHNEIQVIKCINLVKTQIDDSSSISSAESLDQGPVLTYRSIPVKGGINRIRATQQRHQPHLVAAMSDTNAIFIFDIDSHLHSLDVEVGSGTLSRDPQHNRPAHVVNMHRSEGFAVDWSPILYGHLITGDNSGLICLTHMSGNRAFVTDSQPFTGHTGSVEDLQWSPAEKTVFASCSSDGTIKVWDTRSKKRLAAISFKASSTDINVISWNHKINYLLASGAEDGRICVWDLRTLSARVPGEDVAPVASFDWHKGAITSLQWHPADESVLVASGADDQVTIWDLSVELDPEEQAAKQAEGLADVPSQLMFVHMGQKDIKEARWLPQLSGVIVTTAASGFNLFKSAHQA